ncbi:MAG: helix-turn-helix domain-containing protein [Candidatus Electrothrix communis]|nr:MAG: helix-turn-helix domain-containing protein [Candidatus Electrothrix communis]
MGKRHPNPRRVKKHRSYTVEEVAELFGVHKNTVRNWIKTGLSVIDSKRPMLIFGQELANFLEAKRTKNKRPCKPGEMYCVKCRTPKFPAEDMAEYFPDTEKVGNLQAICPDCGTMMNRRVSLAKINAFMNKLDIDFPLNLRHIINSTAPAVNSDLKEGIKS